MHLLSNKRVVNAAGSDQVVAGPGLAHTRDLSETVTNVIRDTGTAGVAGVLRPTMTAHTIDGHGPSNANASHWQCEAARKRQAVTIFVSEKFVLHEQRSLHWTRWEGT